MWREFLSDMLVLSLRDPARAGALLQTARAPRDILWQMFALVVCLSGLLQYTVVALLGDAVARQTPTGTPLLTVAVMACLLTVLIFALYFTARMMGGQGSFPGTILIVTAVQALLLVGQVLQIAAFLILPGLGTLVFFVTLWITLRAAAHYVDALHGFGSVFQASMVLIVAVVGLSFGMALIVSLISLLTGFEMTVEFDNV